MFVWDVVRNRRVHEAWLIWLGINLPFAAVLYSLWGTDWWRSTAERLMGA